MPSIWRFNISEHVRNLAPPPFLGRRSVSQAASDRPDGLDSGSDERDPDHVYSGGRCAEMMLEAWIGIIQRIGFIYTLSFIHI